MSDYILQTKDLTVGYGEKVVVEQADFSVERGEIFSLIGPNGAGKTTLLKALTHQLTPMDGNILLNGKDLNEYKPLELAQTMAVVFSDALRPDRMTCREAVAAGRYPYTGRFGTLSESDEEIIEKAMETVHIAELADRPFDAISDGQRQRVVLARALCQEPDIILLDEPTNFLDIRWRAEFLDALIALAKEEGKTVVLTIHELELAEKISDHIVCVKGNRIDRFGTPSDIFTEDYLPTLFDMDPESFRKWFELK